MTEPGGPAGGGDGEASDAAEALSIVRQLRDLISEILERLTDAVRYGRRTRVMSWLLVASVVLDVALSVVTVRVLAEQGRQQTAIRASQVRACQIGNQSRAAQRQLWDHVIAVSVPPPRESRADRRKRLATLAAFRVYIRREFAPVHCPGLYRK